MATLSPQEQLKRARADRGEDLAALSARTGLRVKHVRAIEEGRFGDLPRGIYGRSAVRTLAAAYGLNPDQLLMECEPLLPQIADPIGALARARGVVPAAHQHASAPGGPACGRPQLGWRPFAAACVDGGVAGALLLVAATAAALLARVSLTALSSSAAPLFVLGLILCAAYYVWLGGLGGTTLGEFALGHDARQRDPRPLTPRAIALRTLAAATADVRAIRSLGEWLGRRLTHAGEDSAPPTAPSPLPLRPRDPGEALTWSMSRRVTVPPLPLHPRRG